MAGNSDSETSDTYSSYEYDSDPECVNPNQDDGVLEHIAQQPAKVAKTAAGANASPRQGGEEGIGRSQSQSEADDSAT